MTKLLDDFSIVSVENLILIRTCPSCNNKYELIEGKNNFMTDPHFCPHCNYNLHEHAEKEKLQRKQEIEQNKHCQLRYDVIQGYECGIFKHPQEQMRLLEYTLFDAVPQMLADCWLFTVDSLIEPLPPYLSKTKYTIGQL